MLKFKKTLDKPKITVYNNIKYTNALMGNKTRDLSSREPEQVKTGRQVQVIARP